MPRLSRKEIEIIVNVLRDRVAHDGDFTGEIACVLRRVERKAEQSKADAARTGEKA